MSLLSSALWPIWLMIRYLPAEISDSRKRYWSSCRCERSPARRRVSMTLKPESLSRRGYASEFIPARQMTSKGMLRIGTSAQNETPPARKRVWPPRPASARSR